MAVTKGPHTGDVVLNMAPAEGNFKSAPSFKRAQTNANMLRNVDKSAQVEVEFKNVQAYVPMLFAPQSGGSSIPCLGSGAAEQPPTDRQVLYGISGKITPGEVLALMGPSGSGKSTLLAILGGRSKARTEGDILFNGSKLTKPLKRKLGYVQQDDLLFAELTVYETLYFTALLRLPRDWSKEDKIARVELVLQGLGLDKCRDTIIGNQMMRGVSGGERKRVSIGVELLINPSVIFLDEPTSGLDSTTALRLMHTLRTLASGGRTIITSIHQPSSRLYQQMDKLLLLSEGHLMYYGHSALAAQWFDLMGQSCPFGTNIADHMLDLANGDMVAPFSSSSDSSRKAASSSSDGGAVAPEDYDENGEEKGQCVLYRAFESRTVGLGYMGIQQADIDAMRALRAAADKDSGVHRAADQEVAPLLPAQDSKSPVVLPQQGGETEAGGLEQRWGATWFDQVRYLTLRNIKTRRFSALSWQKFAQLLVVAVLSGMFWWQIGGRKTLDEQRALDIGGLHFFVLLFMAFQAMFAALFTFPLEFQLLVKERQSGMYRLSAYYIARTLADLPMDCLVPTLFTWIVYFMAGLRLTAGAFFCNWFTVLLLVLVAQSIGLLIGATVMNPQNGQTISTIFMLATMLVGGYYVRNIPVWISWLKYVSFIYWGWNLMLKVEFNDRSYPCATIQENNADFVIPANNECDVEDASVFDINVNEPVTKEACILIAMFIFIRLCVYYALSWKTTFRKK